MIVVTQAPQPPEEPVSERVTVNLTPSEKTRLQAAARRLGVSMSAYVRHLIQEGTK